MASPAKKNGGKKEEATKPVWSRRYWTGSGNLEVAVWSRMVGEGDDARQVLNTSLKKTYKTDTEYKESSSYRFEELGLVILALQEAAHFISEQQNRE